MTTFILILINIILALWLGGLCYLFFGLAKIWKVLSSRGYTQKTLNIIRKEITTTVYENLVRIKSSSSFKSNNITIQMPIKSKINLNLSDKCSSEYDFFVFSKRNIFIKQDNIEKHPEIFQKRSDFHSLFESYSPIFDSLDIKDILIAPNLTSITLKSENIDSLIANIGEIIQFITELHSLIHININIDDQTEPKPEYTSFFKKYQTAITVVMATIAAFMIIGVSLSLVEKESETVSKANTVSDDTFIQAWEIHKSWAKVTDIKELEHSKEIKILSQNKIELKDYAGFKPELTPWGFRVLPKKNFKKHYKILLLPGNTQILGFINHQPIKKVFWGEYLVLLYDLSTIKKASFINIYMRYNQDIIPIPANSYKKDSSLWNTLF